MAIPALSSSLLPETVALFAADTPTAYGPAWAATSTTLAAYIEPMTAQAGLGQVSGEGTHVLADEPRLWMVTGPDARPEPGDKVTWATSARTMTMAVTAVEELRDAGSVHHYESTLVEMV
jgi:hypothetical protein